MCGTHSFEFACVLATAAIAFRGLHENILDFGPQYGAAQFLGFRAYRVYGACWVYRACN